MNNKTHIDHLGENIPELLASDILDVGSGRGDFVISIAMRGGRAIGLEKSPTYRALTKEKAAAERLYVTVVDGVGENMPFPDESFDFVNMSEVIEHVDDPGRVLKEVYRVLRARGKAYISIPNRFGMKDPHFHLYGINWLPRFLADPFIGFFGRHKNYENTEAGIQNLAEMRYATFRGAQCLFEKHGFSTEDDRVLKLAKRLADRGWLVSGAGMIAYRLLRPWYFSTFHFIVTKRP